MFAPSARFYYEKVKLVLKKIGRRPSADLLRIPPLVPNPPRTRGGILKKGGILNNNSTDTFIQPSKIACVGYKTTGSSKPLGLSASLSCALFWMRAQSAHQSISEKNSRRNFEITLIQKVSDILVQPARIRFVGQIARNSNTNCYLVCTSRPREVRSKEIPACLEVGNSRSVSINQRSAVMPIHSEQKT